MVLSFPSCACKHDDTPEQQYEDETGRTAVTFSHGYIADLIDDQQERSRKYDVRLADSMIQYSEMRTGLDELRKKHDSELQEMRSQCIEEECCVCLDELGCAAEVTRTACGHVFHTRCLIDTLADGTVTSCPMCRTDVRELASNELSGKVFRFMCLVRINADTVQSCTRVLKKEIDREVDGCEFEAQALQKWRVLSRLHKERRSVLKARLLHLRTRLQVLEQFSQANLEGLQDIFKHIGDVLGDGMEQWCTKSCNDKMDIFRDIGVTGEYMRITKRLSSVIKYVGMDKSELAAHEQMLREQRGLSPPSFSESHFARCWSSSSCDHHNKEGAETAARANCFPGFRRMQVVSV